MKINKKDIIGQFVFFRQGIYDLETKNTNEYELLLRSNVDNNYYFPEKTFYEIISDREDHSFYIHHISTLLSSILEGNNNIYWLNIEYQELFYEETITFLREFRYKNRLKIEFTERIPMERNNDYEELVPIETISKINEMGYTIALDDFISGINTFDTLNSITDFITRIKISLVSLKKILTAQEAEEISICISKVMNHLGKEVVIEGIEDRSLIKGFPKECKYQSFLHMIPEQINNIGDKG